MGLGGLVGLFLLCPIREEDAWRWQNTADFVIFDKLNYWFVAVLLELVYSSY